LADDDSHEAAAIGTPRDRDKAHLVLSFTLFRKRFFTLFLDGWTH
jgi:hypothetical protein